MAAVWDALCSAVLVCDSTGVILFRNDQARQMLPDSDDLEAALGCIRILGDFPGWHSFIGPTTDIGMVSTWMGVRSNPNQASDIPLVIRCRPTQPEESDSLLFVIQIDERAKWDGSDANEMYRRLAALGKLTAQVAHELNNPLDGILRYLKLASRLASELPGTKLQSYLDESRTGVTRMVQVVGELLEFSRATDGEFDELDVNEIVEQAVHDTMTAKKTKGIVVTVDFQLQSMPTVRGNRLYQVCRNLIKNAIDAMPGGGRLSITTGLANAHVVIRVTDTGVGLPDDPQKAFEAFYTTKPAGAGTGLGLAICKDYIENMGGSLTAAPGEDGGAVFTIMIPESACGPVDRRLRKQARLDD